MTQFQVGRDVTRWTDCPVVSQPQNKQTDHGNSCLLGRPTGPVQTSADYGHLTLVTSRSVASSFVYCWIHGGSRHCMQTCFHDISETLRRLLQTTNRKWYIGPTSLSRSVISDDLEWPSSSVAISNLFNCDFSYNCALFNWSSMLNIRITCTSIAHCSRAQRCLSEAHEQDNFADYRYKRLHSLNVL